MSRHDIPAKRPGLAVVVGRDNPMSTFFAQVEDEAAGEDDDPVVLWLGGRHREVLRPEDLAAPLAPYADLSAAHIEQLRSDRAGDADRGPTALQRLGIDPPWRITP